MKKVILLILIFLSTLFSSQKETDNIAQLSSVSLYNIDKLALVNTAKAYIENRPNLKALKIVETLSGETYFQVEKQDNKIVFVEKFSQQIDALEKFTAKSKYANEIVGTIEAYFKKEIDIELTPKEQEFLKKNSVIRVQNQDAMAPFNFREFNQPKGFSIELIELVAQKIGLKVEYIHGYSWKESIEMLKSNKIDVMLNIVKNPKRSEFIDFTDPYSHNQHGIIMKEKDDNIQTFTDLIKFGKTITYVKGYFYEQFVKKYPDAKVKLVNNDLEALQLLAYGQTDAVLGVFSTMSYTAQKNNLPFFHYFSDPTIEIFKPIQVRFGVSKGNSELVSILQKGLGKLTQEEIKKITDKWLKLTTHENVTTLDLTDEEKKWIGTNPDIKVIKFFDEPPFTLNTKIKSGYVYELIEYLIESAGLNIKYIDGFSSYGDMLQALEKGEVDLLTTFPTSLNLDSKSTIRKSKSILKTPFVLISRSNSKKINSIKDLDGKKVAVVKGYMQDKYLSAFPKVKKVFVTNNEEGFEAIRSGKAEYYINNKANSQYVLNKSFATDLKVNYELPYSSFPPLSISFAMNGQKETLVSILNKALDQVPYQKIKTIRDNWIISAQKDKPKVLLTKQEREFLEKHKKIVLGADENWQPFDYKDVYGEHAGFNADYLKLLRNKLGIDIEVKLGNWSKLQDQVKTKEIDGLVGPSKTPQRDQYMSFTKAYFVLKEVILIRNEKKSLNRLNQLNGKTLALKEGSSNIQYFSSKYPKIKQKIYKTNADIIRAVSIGEVDAGISNIGAASSEMQKNFISNLKIGYEITELAGDMRFGIRKDWTILSSILQKGIDAITQDEFSTILKRWITLSSIEKKSKGLHIAFGYGRAPFMFDKSSKKGIEIDLVKRALELQGHQISMIHQMAMSKQQEVISDIDSMIDVAVTLPEKPIEGIYYSDIFLTFNNGVYTRKSDKLKISSPKDLIPLKTVAWNNAHNTLTPEYHELFKPQNAPSTYKEIGDQFEQHEMFFSHKSDAIVVDKTIFNYNKNRLKFKYDVDENYDFHKIFPPFTGYKVAFKDQKIRDDFNKGIKALKQSGEYDKIIKAYFEVDIDSQLKFTQVMASVASKFIADDNEEDLKKVLKVFYKMPFIEGFKLIDNETKEIFKEQYKKPISKNHPLNLIIEKAAFFTDRGIPIKIGDLTVYFNKNAKTQKITIPKLEAFNGLNSFYQLYIKNVYLQNELIKKDKKNKVKLTKEEKLFIKNNPVIKVHNEKNWPPFNFYEFGQAKGYSVDLMKLVAKNTGLNIEFISGPTWNEFLEKMKNGEHDVMINIVKSEERDKYMLFTDPFISALHGIAVHKDTTDIKTFKDIIEKDKTIALERGFFYHEYLEKNYPNVKLNLVDDGAQTLSAVSYKKSDATLGILPVMNYLADKNYINNLKFFGDSHEKLFEPIDLRFSVRKDQALLQSILQKGLGSITPEEKRELSNRWLGSGEETIKIDLTNEERKWLNEHKNIRFTGDPDWLPFEAFNEKNQYVGIVAEHLKIIENRIGIKFNKIKPDNWEDAVNKALNQEVDIISEVVADNPVSTAMSYTKSYIKTPLVVIMRNEDKQNFITDLNTISDKKIAYVSGYGYVSKLKKEYPSIKFNEVKTVKEGLEAVSTGKIDAFVCSLTIGSYNITEESISNLDIVGKLNIVMKLGFGVRKDWQILINILNKAINSISTNESKKIKQLWLGSNFNEMNEYKIKLSKQEEEWLKNNETLKYVYDVDWAPFEWKNELGEHTGIIFDILSLIEQRSGINFEQIETNKWSEAVDLMKSDKADMYSGMGENPERKEYLNFTKNTIFKTPYVFVSRENDKNDYLETFKVIKNKKVAVVDGYTIHGLLKENVPKLPLLTVKSIGEGFEKVRSGELDIFIVNAATAKYFINREGYDDLKIATKTEFNLELKIALQKEIAPEALSIIDKAIESINEKEISDIYFKWTEILVEEKIDWDLIYKIVGGALVALLLITYWNRKLKKTVDDKTAELQKLLSSFDENVIASKTDPKGIIIYASKAFCEISGYKEEELVGQPQCIVRHPDMPKSLFKDLWQTIKKGHVWKGEVKNRKKNGGFYWVDVVITPELDAEGNIAGYSAIRHDITSKKEVEELSANLEIKVEERTLELKQSQEEIQKNKIFLDTLLDSQEQIVITTNGKTLKSCNQSFLEFFSLNNIEEFTKDYDCICDKFVVDESGMYLQKYMGNLTWIEYILEHPEKNNQAVIVKDGQERIFSVSAAILPIGDEDLKSAVFTDVTELENIRKNIETILSNIMLPVLITSKKERKILYANEYASKQYEASIDELVGKSIDSVYTSMDQKDEILSIMSDQGYVENLEERYKTQTGKEFIGLLSVKPIVYNGEEAYVGMVVDITQQKEIEEEIREIHKHTQSSIEYASLIQHSLIPSNDTFKKYFEDYFTIWHPKDIVGGDIYLFEELRNEDECLLMVIDCTGHGVPGAFVTMLVKAIERQVAALIATDPNMEVSPGWILQYFNQTMKKLLKQEDDDAISNAGFDGAVLYYNKKEQIVRFSGAELPLFYCEDGEFKTIKGNRHSIGYKKSDANFEFKEHIIEAKAGMQFYLTSDGYLDQNGGEKGFPFGKKRFLQILDDYKDYSFADQQEVLLNELAAYQKDEERNDDISIVGIKIAEQNTQKVSKKNSKQDWTI